MAHRTSSNDLREIRAAIKNMRNGIMAALYHITQFQSQDRRHQFCPEGPESWCPHKRGENSGDKKHHISPDLFKKLLPIFEKRSSDNYLNRVVAGHNTNVIESLNNQVWLRIPKSMSHGRIRLEIAADLGFMSFENGNDYKIRIREELNLPLSQDQQNFYQRVNLIQNASRKIASPKTSKKEKRLRLCSRRI